MEIRFGDTARPYGESHPWITFAFDAAALNPRDYVHLGEALSKCDHIAGVPLPPAIARELHGIYLAKGIHATTQIEGNTLSEEEVKKRVQGQLELPESQEYLGQEVDNILAACELIADDLIAGRDMRLTRVRIEQFNALVLRDLPLGEGVVPGRIREDSVTVGNVYRGAPSADCGYLLDELCRWLDSLVEGVEGENSLREVKLLRAILAHLYLAWIHPFGDGNGRTARLVEFQLLAEAGFPTPACHLLSNYYNRTRTRYYGALQETSRRPPYQASRFVSYALQGLVEELREQLKTIQAHQLRIAWENFVHGEHLGESPQTVRRRRALILSLPVEKFTPRSQLQRMNPLLAEMYANKTPKTLTRDINELESTGLVAVRGAQARRIQVRPRIERVLAFLPLRADSGA
jgi:Fic family protein